MLYQYSQNKMPIHHRHAIKKQQGVAIIAALFIVALVAAMAYTMMARLERDTRRTQLILRDTQAEFYAQGSIAWAMDQLYNNWLKQKPTRLIDVTPIKAKDNEINGYHLASTIYDMQARYNLNNLVQPEAQHNFTHLLRAVEPTLTEVKAEEITSAIADWISPSSNQSEYSKYYYALSPPYRAAHRAFISVSELHLVKGITAKLFTKLQAYVTALPEATAINVETAEAPVLATLSPTMTLAAANSIVEARKGSLFVSPDVFMSLPVVKNNQVKQANIVTVSTYFLIETIVTIEKQRLVLYTLVERMTANGKANLHIVWQSKGLW